MRKIGTFYIVISLFMALCAVAASLNNDNGAYYAACFSMALTILCGLLDR